MKTTTLRVRKVTFRDGRTVERIPSWPARDEINNKLIEHARIIAGKPKRLDGFAVVAWFSDGTRTSGYRLRNDSAIGETMMPALVHDVLMRNISDPRE